MEEPQKDFVPIRLEVDIGVTNQRVTLSAHSCEGSGPNKVLFPEPIESARLRLPTVIRVVCSSNDMKS